ncbi:hypothetical protein D9613_007880 [Agrocybe pediades]|uniref:histidine kinase n=1 Tax=Agrocybe pediades TaxID=84607 RepID=A0A8H4QNB1_9AGAR|nr:hypothetical protein D9613_007880 [Agrocybe pediades]
MHQSDASTQLAAHPSLSPSIDRPHLSGYMVQQRSASSKFSRPSTAPPAHHEDNILLPSTPSAISSLSRSSSAVSVSEPVLQDSHRQYNGPTSQEISQMVQEDDEEVDTSFRIEALAERRFSSNDSVADKFTISRSVDCDWATFMSAYGDGRWDPNRTPNPPIPCTQIIADSHRYAGYETLSKTNDFKIAPEAQHQVGIPIESKNPEDIVSASSLPTNNVEERLSIPLPPSLAGLSVNSTGSIKSRPTVPLRLPTHRFRNSFSASFAPSSGTQTPSSVSDVHATVATMRWAAACVDISPLALPSPEHELTDPMRGVVATIPGSQPLVTVPTDHLYTPGGTRRSRLNIFWEGTTDVYNSNADSSLPLETIIGSPPETEETGSVEPEKEKLKEVPSLEEPRITPNEPSAVHPEVVIQPSVLPKGPPPLASAPVIASYEPVESPSDYFGNVSIASTNGYSSSASSSSKASSTSTAVPPQKPAFIRNGESVPQVTQPSSVPALPRRLCLTRQTSSPLPGSSPPQAQFLGNRAPSETISSVKLTKAVKEERMFAELGYLAPPYPRNELERRRALYKFNILNTGPDNNFDRIAHLAKLVFNTKGVLISLIDRHDQWIKSEWGLKTPNGGRAQSFCGHAILQQGDEPMIVLDSLKDWRFEKNPSVTGPPHIRFYAGAPLRTQDGYNIGTLAVIDDQLREEFSPRQRHTLKEFAAIVMREMELWSDKIQLRIRSRIQHSMEQFTRECLEIDNETNGFEHRELNVGSSMDKMYDRAAKLVQRTLDVEGVIVMDVSHCEVLESMSAEGSVSVTLHHGDPDTEMTKRQLTTEEYHRLNNFFEKHPDGRISEGIVPASFKPFLPTHVQYALTVPIYNIDKRPFALLCAYNTHHHAKRFLEGYELSYLRAIGVVILSAVLKRRMILADKAKGLFISNISHELRTPLHGILAAAELLSESPLNHSQASFLQTVQACGTSLVETVNHVLDFTKLSGNSKAGGVENVIVPTNVDLMLLVEEAVDGCWIGHRARTAIMDDSGIGSVYAPPRESQKSPPLNRKHVETIIDIGFRAEGWLLKCEKGGIRRVLMNLFGNSLKFTSEGYVHVLLRQLPPSGDDPPDKVRVELAVYDTGKGISQNFLKNQLFHPFTQENPLQTGTGLGLAIVSSIVTSENVGGKVDVWSEEGVGTEIKVTFLADVPESGGKSAQLMQPFGSESADPLPKVSLLGFSNPHKGTQLLKTVLEKYLTTWWDFELVKEDGDIVIINDDPDPIIEATERRDIRKTYIILSAARGNPNIMSIVAEHERIGGFCRILYKPGGPSRLREILKLCVHALKIGKSRSASPVGPMNGDAVNGTTMEDRERALSGIHRRNSEEASTRSHSYHRRPSMTPRSSTAHPTPSAWNAARAIDQATENEPDPDTPVQTISLGTGGTLLKSSVGPPVESLEFGKKFRVLVVEDNSILRNLLIKWLSSKGYTYCSAVNGHDGVNVFKKDGPFDVVLLDLSMPVLDGVGATKEMRSIEEEMKKGNDNFQPARILALTGMSSLEDKRRAFDAGVDGYLVKPVAFKTLDETFRKLGLS